MTSHRYVMRYRPASRYTLPQGVTWGYVETPTMFGLANLPLLPISRHRYGVIETSRALTADEMRDFEIDPVEGAPCSGSS